MPPWLWTETRRGAQVPGTARSRTAEQAGTAIPDWILLQRPRPAQPAQNHSNGERHVRRLRRPPESTVCVSGSPMSWGLSGLESPNSFLRRVYGGLPWQGSAPVTWWKFYGKNTASWPWGPRSGHTSTPALSCPPSFRHPAPESRDLASQPCLGTWALSVRTQALEDARGRDESIRGG